MARGRKRKTGTSRAPNGRTQRSYTHQQEAENLCVVVEARQRHLGVTQKQATDAKSGHTMGVLNIRGIVDDRQLDASRSYVMDYLRVHRLKGWPRPHPKVASYAEMIAGMSSGHEPDSETIQNAVDKWNAATNAIIDSLGMREAMPAIHALKMFALYETHPDECTPARAGPLRCALNALAKHYGV